MLNTYFRSATSGDASLAKNLQPSTFYLIMADGFLEKHQQDYEARKEAYLRKKRHLPKLRQTPQRPDDEAL